MSKITDTLKDLTKDRDDMITVSEITSAFEGIASMRISQIKDLVSQSEAFFNELWRIYSQIRVDELFHFGRSMSNIAVSPKELLILITFNF